MTKLAPEWVRTSDPVIRSPARYRWTTAPALFTSRKATECLFYNIPPDSTLVSTLILLFLHMVHIYAIYSVVLVYDVW